MMLAPTRNFDFRLKRGCFRLPQPGIERRRRHGDLTARTQGSRRLLRPSRAQRAAGFGFPGRYPMQYG
jgi:hypothetical protein